MHWSGNTPEEKERLNIRQIEEVITSATSLRILPGILSGPQAFLGSIAFNSSRTSAQVSWIKLIWSILGGKLMSSSGQ